MSQHLAPGEGDATFLLHRTADDKQRQHGTRLVVHACNQLQLGEVRQGTIRMKVSQDMADLNRGKKGKLFELFPCRRVEIERVCMEFGKFVPLVCGRLFVHRQPFEEVLPLHGLCAQLINRH